jgi:hypothetical protein
VDFDTGGTLVMNGGTASFNDTVKFPDNDDGAVYIYLYGGLLTCGDTESYANRGSELHVGEGIMRTGLVTEPRRDPDSTDWNIQPLPPYGVIVITDLGGGVKEISAARPTIEVAFTSAASSALETVSNAVLNVNLSTAAEQTVRVDYEVTGGTAIRGTDYNLPDGTLSFVAGDTSEEISIDIIADGLDEDDETITIGLTNPTGTDVELGQITEHTYTIIDPRPTVQFASAASRGRENFTPAYVTVELSHSWPQTVTVDYTVIGGTAARDTDYVLADGTVTFDPFQSTKTIAIDIIDDDLEEGNETILLMLSNPTGSSRLGANSHCTFTISEGTPLLRGAFYFRADSDPTARIGEHPDVMVRLGDAENKLIFRRNKGYLPVWYVEDVCEQDLPTEASRNGCETTVNWHSRVEIVETSPARAVVHWRYATNCSRTSMTITDWVDEYFTVYPDGVCIRAINNAAGTTYSQWLSTNPVVRNLQLVDEGVADLPPSWLNPPALVLNSGDYANEGFDPTQRGYILQTDITCAPTTLNCTLNTSGGKSIHNPAIVVKNWGDAQARVTVNGCRPDLCYTGYAHDVYGDNLVVWLAVESTASVNVAVAPIGGSGQFVDRAKPPTHSYDFDDSPPLPLGSPEPGQFGAYYTNLRFNDRFDQEFRYGEHADVVVQFAYNAHRFVFWRGTNYQPHLVGDTSETSENPHLDQDIGIPGIPYSCWYGTQFVERRGEEWGIPRYLEPMSDQQCRYAHIRIISSNAARAIVQWRYAPCHLDYQCNNDDSDPWGDWVNEYYVIYPDAVSVRKVEAWSRRTGDAYQENPHIEFHEMIPITNPGTVPEDNIHWHALSATDYNGNKKDWAAQDVDGGAMTSLDQISGKPIMVVRMKGSTVPITVFEGTSTQHDPVGQHDCRPFNHYDDWPAWPDNDRSMGGWLWDEDPSTHCYRYFWTKYPAHCSTLHVKWQDYEHIQDKKRTKIMLFGMYDGESLDQTRGGSVNNLIPLARSWEYAPDLTITSDGFSGGGYDKAERAYKIARDSEQAVELTLTMNASSASPVYNPCFVIENWGVPARLSVNGQSVEAGTDFRQAVELNSQEVPSLVVWVKAESTSATTVTISEPVPGDLDADGDVDGADLDRFVWQWLAKSLTYPPLAGDLNGDHKTDFTDFAALASHWLEVYR